METKRLVIVVLTLIIVTGLVLIHTATNYGDQIVHLLKVKQPSPSAPLQYVGVGETHQLESLLVQRNAVSKELNMAKKTFGQQSCEILKYKQKVGEKVDPRVSSSGGWCAEVSGENSPAHKWDKPFSTALSKFLAGKTVGSFGDGPGMYKKHLDELKEVKSYTAYDGAPFCENTTSGRVQFLDLSVPQYGLPAYDWVVSVEVGEHIPKPFQEIYMDNLVRHAKEGIILSWAVPGQGGLSHVNLRTLEDVAKSMSERHFTLHKDEGAPLRNAATFSWLRANIHVYRRHDESTFVPLDS